MSALNKRSNSVWLYETVFYEWKYWYSKIKMSFKKKYICLKYPHQHFNTDIAIDLYLS